MQYEKELRVAIDAALEAGEHLRRELHHWGGPRGHGLHAEADEEAEWLIRKRLVGFFPEHSYLGEETGAVAGTDSHIWLVDPNDGTTAFLRGARGSAVSIGLLRDSIPVLGVIYSFALPDDRGDLIYWAEGFELTRNGSAVRPQWDTSRRNQMVVLVSMHREDSMEALIDCCFPLRYRAVPSIAYRLGLAAVGDGAAAVSYHSPGAWDYAAGHALLRGAGGIFVNEQGQEVTYGTDGTSKTKFCFGGEPSVVRDLWRREWSRVPKTVAKMSDAHPRSLFSLARPWRGKAVASADLVARAQGALMGQCAGDAFGQQVEFQTAETIRNRYPRGLHIMEDGGTHNTLAGQPTDDSEMALMLGRSILQSGRYDREKVAQAYWYWSQTDPFDIGLTISKALLAVTESDCAQGKAAEVMSAGADSFSQANGSLMRISPLAIYGYRKTSGTLWEMAEQESMLTHPSAICRQACAVFVVSLADAIQSGRSAPQVYERALRIAAEFDADPAVQDALRVAASAPPVCDGKSQGWVLIALQNAFYELLHSNNFEDGVRNTALRGGDTDTNAAIAGALLGAVHGRDAIPFQWRQMVLTCRAHRAAGAQRPRPFCFWPVDIYTIAESLLITGWA